MNTAVENGIYSGSEAWQEAATIREVLLSLAQHMLASMDPGRTDRLWPADVMVFQTNPLNLAHGACGTALYLHETLGEIPARVRQWLLDQPVTVAKYPPGLYSGIAGVAWCFAELGLAERGLEMFRLVTKSPLAFRLPDIFSGVAGWGLAALALYERTGEDWLGALACRAGDFLVETAERDENGAFWTDRDESIVRLGFAYGGSGIATFLLNLWKATGDERYLSTARGAMDFEVANAQERGDSLVWGAVPNSNEHRPYWLRGGAGAATALTRFAVMLDDQHYMDLARRAARGCNAFFSVSPHLFEGLASMGESLLDMYVATGEEAYLRSARQKASQILLYRMDTPAGLAFPGRYLLRISHDYGLGGAGVGMYLHRLLAPGPRRFHDILGDPPRHLSLADAACESKTSLVA
jgi:hypothetical protein